MPQSQYEPGSQLDPRQFSAGHAGQLQQSASAGITPDKSARTLVNVTAAVLAIKRRRLSRMVAQRSS
jgi:hypothetical protein